MFILLFRRRRRNAMSIVLASVCLAFATQAQQTVESDLSLQHAEELLLSGNPDLLAARFASRAAHADVITAGEAPNPQLSFNSTGGDIKRGIGAGYPWDKRLDSVVRIDQQLERGDKRGLRVKAANSAAAAADLDTADVLRSAKQVLAESYYDLKYAQEATASYANVLELQQQSLNAAQAQLQAGDVAVINVSRLKIEVARAQADLLRAQQSQRAAQISLANILGTTKDSASLRAIDAWPDITGAVTAVDAAVPAALIRQRPDVLAAEERNHAASQNVQLAQAQRSRDVTVGVQYEHDLTQGPGVNSWGVGFSVPLFLRNHYQGEIARAAADRDSAAEALRRATRNAQHEIEQAATDLDVALKRLQKYQGEVLEEAQTSAQAAEYAYRRGALSLTDLLDARRALQAVNLDALDAHNAYAKALAAWRAATAANVANDQPVITPQ